MTVFAHAASFVPRARAARKGNDRLGLIVLKNSCLIEGVIADSIPLLIGRSGDDGTEAGGAGSTVL